MKNRKNTGRISQYNGLVYSEADQGGYCKYCVLFGKAAASVTNFTGALITIPLTNFQKASKNCMNILQVLVVLDQLESTI